LYHFYLGKLGFAYFSPFAFITVRYIFGTISFGTIFAKHLRNIPRSTWKRGAMLGSLVGVGLLLQNQGLSMTTASNAGFITGMMVIFTPLAQIFFLKKKPKAGNFIGIIVVSIGLYLLTKPGGDGGIRTGDILVLVASVLFGIYIVFLDVFTKEEDFLKLGFVGIMSTGVVSLFFLPFETVHVQFTLGSAAIIFFFAIIATVLTTYVQNRYQKETTPTAAVIIFSAEPVIGAFLAYHVLNEVMGWIGIVGGALIIGGILVSEFAEDVARKLSWTTQPAGEEE
jgi:drug/metabolite transporter (DMT)-like permease